MRENIESWVAKRLYRVDGPGWLQYSSTDRDGRSFGAEGLLSVLATSLPQLIAPGINVRDRKYDPYDSGSER